MQHSTQCSTDRVHELQLENERNTFFYFLPDSFLPCVKNVKTSAPLTESKLVHLEQSSHLTKKKPVPLAKLSPTMLVWVE